MNRRLLYAPEAAELVGVKPATIRSWVHRGHLVAFVYDKGRAMFLDSAVYQAERATRRVERKK